MRHRHLVGVAKEGVLEVGAELEEGGLGYWGVGELGYWGVGNLWSWVVEEWTYLSFQEDLALQGVCGGQVYF
jgi:hypothetical protein